MKYVKSYKIFEGNTAMYSSEIVRKAKYDSKWGNITDKIPELGFDAISAFSHKYDDNYGLLLLIRKSEHFTQPMLYFDDSKRDSRMFIENLYNVYADLYKSLYERSPLDYCIKRGDDVLKIFRKIDKLPPEEKIIDTFQELVDDGLMLNQIKYGQTAYKFPEHEWDTEVYIDNGLLGRTNEPVKCVMFFESSVVLGKNQKNDIDKNFKFCKERLLLEYNVVCKIIYTGENHLIITIQNR